MHFDNMCKKIHSIYMSNNETGYRAAESIGNDEEWIDDFIHEIEQFAHEQDLSEDQKGQLYRRIQTNLECRLEEALAEKALSQLIHSMRGLFYELDSSHSDPTDFEHEDILAEQIRRISSGEEPLDVLYAVDEAGHISLDPDYLPAVLRIALNKIRSQEEGGTEEELAQLLPIINETRKRIMQQNIDSPRHVPPLRMLSGGCGLDKSREYAMGALDAVRHLIESTPRYPVD